MMVQFNRFGRPSSAHMAALLQRFLESVQGALNSQPTHTPPVEPMLFQPGFLQKRQAE